MVVRFYTRRGCHLCETALAVVRRAQESEPFALEIHDIDADPELRARYTEEVPVTELSNGRRFRYGVDYQEFLKALRTPGRAGGAEA